MTYKNLIITLSALVFSGCLYASNEPQFPVQEPAPVAEKSAPAASSTHSSPAPQDVQKKAEGILENVVTDNDRFARKTPDSHFNTFKESQAPRATMVLCSDSRVQTEAFDFTPENDLFVVRNVGNQFASNPGSVEYGVNHLNTPVLFVVGHSGCGAIKAAYEDYSRESADIKRELDTIQVKSAPDIKEAVLVNVNNQVEEAKKKFSDKVNSGALIIVGGVYDFRNDYGRGDGQFIITNLNGETDSKKIESSPYFEKVKGARIGINMAVNK